MIYFFYKTNGKFIVESDEKEMNLSNFMKIK